MISYYRSMVTAIIWYRFPHTATYYRPVASLLIKEVVFLGFWTFFRVRKLEFQWLSTENLDYSNR